MLEILAGIVIGPSVLGIVHLDTSISVIAVLGLAFLLFLAGLEIEFDKLRGQVLRLTLIGFAVSFAIAVLAALLLKALGLIETPLLVAIILCATSLGVLIPVLKDAGEIGSTFGQLIVAAGTIADFGAVILLSIFFSGEGGVGPRTSPGTPAPALKPRRPPTRTRAGSEGLPLTPLRLDLRRGRG